MQTMKQLRELFAVFLLHFHCSKQKSMRRNDKDNVRKKKKKKTRTRAGKKKSDEKNQRTRASTPPSAQPLFSVPPFIFVEQATNNLVRGQLAFQPFFARLSQYRFPGMYVTLHDYIDWLHRRMLMRIFCPLPATNRRLYLDDRTTYTVYFGNGRPVGA